MAEVKNAQKKGTVKTETIIGQGASKLNGAVKTIQDTIAKLSELPNWSEQLAAEIADKEQRLNELETQFKEKKRQLEVQLELDMKQTTAMVVNRYLADNDLTTINPLELTQLKAKIADLETREDAAIKKEVAIVTNSLKSNYESQLRLKDAEHATKEASNIAEIRSLQQQLTAQKEETLRWKTSLDQERQAGIDRAKANAIGNVNIAQPTR